MAYTRTGHTAHTVYISVPFITQAMTTVIDTVTHTLDINSVFKTDHTL